MEKSAVAYLKIKANTRELDSIQAIMSFMKDLKESNDTIFDSFGAIDETK